MSLIHRKHKISWVRNLWNVFWFGADITWRAENFVNLSTLLGKFLFFFVFFSLPQLLQFHNLTTLVISQNMGFMTPKLWSLDFNENASGTCNEIKFWESLCHADSFPLKWKSLKTQGWKICSSDGCCVELWEERSVGWRRLVEQQSRVRPSFDPLITFRGLDWLPKL